MANSTYKVTSIRVDMESKYREFWIDGKRVSDDGIALHPAMLADTDLIEARNEAEANELGRKKFPGRTIEVSRLG